MNKEQEKIAIVLLSTIKENDGLVDLGLIDNSMKSVFRLTEKGWKFRSFRKLYFDNKLQLINTKIVLFVAIVTILLNLYQTFWKPQ